jgi:DNA-binding IclR family transcriptional regulator
VGEDGRTRDWALVSSHGLVLACLAAEPDATLRAVAARLGLTERQVGRLVRDLAAAGLLRVERRGRRNRYAVDPAARLRHPTLAHVPLGRLLAALAAPPAAAPGPPAAAAPDRPARAPGC